MLSLPHFTGTLADVLVRPDFSLQRGGPLGACIALSILGVLVCLFLILLRLFRAKGGLHGVLGILSLGVYPFIWGWMAPKDQKLGKIMVVWTVLAIGVIVLVLSSRPAPRPIRYPWPQEPTPAPPVEKAA